MPILRFGVQFIDPTTKVKSSRHFDKPLRAHTAKYD